MLTRLEVDGFKNLLGFAVDFGPFTCIAGPNGVGKSNVFDAIRFLSLLADHTLVDAALKVRSSDAETADLLDLFWKEGDRRADSFRIAAEMIVQPEVTDELGQKATAASTYLRYEIRIGYQRESERQRERIGLLSESLDYFIGTEAKERLRFPHSVTKFRRGMVRNTARGATPFIATSGGGVVVHDRGWANSKLNLIAAAPRTVVGATNSIVTPTILAARREMQRWRLLALEPTAMRGTDRLHTDPHITASGEHIPATLYRLAGGTSDNGGDARVYARIASRLSELVPISEVRVQRDDVRQLLALSVRETAGTELPSRSLSDGTLRFLALSVLGEDPESHGVICMEEPENGIHPAKMQAMAVLLRSLAVNPWEAPGPDNPMRQVIVATHSPALVQLQNPDDLLFAVGAKVRGEGGVLTDTLRCRPLTGTWRCTETERGVGLGTLLAYLTTPPGAQVSLADLGMPMRREVG